MTDLRFSSWQEPNYTHRDEILPLTHSLTHPICRGVIPTEQEVDRATGGPYPMAGGLLKAERCAKAQQWCLYKDKGRAYQTRVFRCLSRIQ